MLLYLTNNTVLQARKKVIGLGRLKEITNVSITTADGNCNVKKVLALFNKIDDLHYVYK